MPRRELPLDVLLDPEARIHALEEGLKALTHAFLIKNNGCFPISQSNAPECLCRDAMAQAYALVGDPDQEEMRHRLAQFETLAEKERREYWERQKKLPAHAEEDTTPEGVIAGRSE